MQLLWRSRLFFPLSLTAILLLTFIIHRHLLRNAKAISLSEPNPIAVPVYHDPYVFNMTSEILPESFAHPVAVGEGKENATLLVLCQNKDLQGILDSIEQVESRFNGKYGYPWVFLNEENFSDEFKANVVNATRAPVSFGRIPRSHWYQPDWIDEEKAKRTRYMMKSQRIVYGDSQSYRNMCRFNSGFFFRHPMLEPYRYYWRVEPRIQYSCDITYDPFTFMKDNNKTYGFTISFYEWKATIKTLWQTVQEFTAQNPQYVAENNSMSFLSDDGGENYNLCHFWSNFEIADMDFWRSEAYRKFFDFLDEKGGFYYERWGDAPIHSIAAALFLPKSQLHFFRDIGYKHSPFQHCPGGDDWARGKCACNTTDSMENVRQSCIPRYEELMSR